MFSLVPWAPWMQIAKSFVILPDSTHSTQACSRASANLKQNERNSVSFEKIQLSRRLRYKINLWPALLRGSSKSVQESRFLVEQFLSSWVEKSAFDSSTENVYLNFRATVMENTREKHNCKNWSALILQLCGYK